MASAKPTNAQQLNSNRQVDVSALQALHISSESVGMIVEKNVDKKPNSEGILFSRKVLLPEFKKGIYYRPFSSPNRITTGNRISGVAFTSISGLANYKTTITNKIHDNMEEGQYILLEITMGDTL